MQEQEHTALLVMDMQQGILGNYPEKSQLISNTAKAISFARSKNIPVIYVVVGFRDGFPEIATSNKFFSASRERFASVDMSEWMKVIPELAPREGEVTCIKKRISAFTGSDLEVVLRAGSMRHLVLCGIATSGVVLSTLREAADKDFHLTVLQDCCADADPEVHQLLTTKIFPRQANVINVADWTK